MDVNVVSMRYQMWVCITECSCVMGFRTSLANAVPMVLSGKMLMVSKMDVIVVSMRYQVRVCIAEWSSVMGFSTTLFNSMFLV